MNVSEVIHEKGYTIKEVSKLLGLHEKTLTIMLKKSREHDSMRVSTLRRIADVLGCHISEFFRDEPITKNGVEVRQEEDMERKGRLVLDMGGAIERSGLQKKEVAKRIGITDVAMSVMLRQNNPTYQRMQEIADVLGISVFDLFAWEEVKETKKRGRKPKAE